MVLPGKLTVLREKRLEDASRDYDWRCDPELARYDAVSPLRISFDNFLPHYRFELEHPSPYQVRFAIEDQAGKHIGNCMYYNLDLDKKQAELGIMIGDRDYWGVGYGTDAVKTMVGTIFSTTAVERVYLSTLDWNYRAQRCFEKSGFVRCGSYSWNSSRFIVMEIRRDWLENPQAEKSPTDPSSAP